MKEKLSSRLTSLINVSNWLQVQYLYSPSSSGDSTPGAPPTTYVNIVITVGVIFNCEGVSAYLSELPVPLLVQAHAFAFTAVHTEQPRSDASTLTAKTTSAVINSQVRGRLLSGGETPEAQLLLKSGVNLFYDGKPSFVNGNLILIRSPEAAPFSTPEWALRTRGISPLTPRMRFQSPHPAAEGASFRIRVDSKQQQAGEVS